MSPVSFFQPGYLWGLFALALPVIIHLLGRRRSRRLDFSTLRFFRATAVRAHRARRIKRLLLLCSRLLLLATIVIIFSHPSDKNDPFAMLVNPNSAVYCWVDPTKSMDYVDRGSPLWRRAMATVDSLDKRAPFSLRRYWYDELQGKFVLKRALRGDIRYFSRHGRSFCKNMIAAFNEEVLHSSQPAVLLILSDFQENISRALDSFVLADTVKSRIICATYAPIKPVDAGITKVIASRERPVAVEGVINAVGTGRRHAGVSVFFGDMRVGHENVLLQGDCRKTFRMDIGGGDHPGGCVRLETDDPFQLDNIRYFVCGDGGRRRAIVIGDSVQSFPIAAALRSIGDSQWSPVIQRSLHSLSINDIDSADMIVLSEIPFVPQPLRLLRTTRFFSPKAIIVSPAVDSQSFTATVSLVGLPPGSRLRSIHAPKPCGLVFYDTISMLGKGFHKLRDNDVDIERYIEPLPGSVLCGLDVRKPLATHLLDSLGHSWVLFAAPLGRTPSNNLCETGLFVPLIDRIARLSLESIHKESDEWIAGKPRRNPFLGSRHPAFLYTVQNERQAQWGNQLHVKIDEPGIYRIQPYDLPSFWIAVNADSEETSLVYRTPQASMRSKNAVAVIRADAFLSHLRAGAGGFFSYGPWIALAVFIFAEMLLWERDNGHKRQTKGSIL